VTTLLVMEMVVGLHNIAKSVFIIFCYVALYSKRVTYAVMWYFVKIL